MSSTDVEKTFLSLMTFYSGLKDNSFCLPPWPTLFYLVFLLLYLSQDVSSCLSVRVPISFLISSLSGSRGSLSADQPIFISRISDDYRELEILLSRSGHLTKV